VAGYVSGGAECGGGLEAEQERVCCFGEWARSQALFELHVLGTCQDCQQVESILTIAA
jgi:hypothetical protein